MNQQQASDKLIESVFIPVFFQKLAAAGIVPTTEQEQRELLYLAEVLPTKQQKQAAETSSLIGLAAQGMREHLGHSQAVKQASEEKDIAAAVDIWAEDAELVKAASILS